MAVDKSEPSRSWTFGGRVLPERAPLYATFPSVEVRVDDFDFVFQITIRIAASQFIAEVKVRGEPDIFTLRNSVEDVIRWHVDLVGYQQGLALDVEVVSASGADGAWRIFGAENPALQNIRRGDPQGLLEGQLSAKLMEAASGEPATMAVLSDFREALKTPHQTGFFCYRAAEAIMQTFKRPDSRSESAAWSNMRQALNIDRPTLDFIKSHADWSRHGLRQSITDVDRSRLLILTDEIVRRFLEYLQRGEIDPAAGADPALHLKWEPQWPERTRPR